MLGYTDVSRDPASQTGPHRATLPKETPCPPPPASEQPEPDPRSRNDALVSAATLQRHPDATTSIHLVFVPGTEPQGPRVP